MILIHSHLSYCISTWGGAPNWTLNLIIKLQKRAVRIITNSAYDSHTKPLLTNLKILNISNLYNFNLAIAFHKQLHNNTIGSNNLIHLNTIHDHHTRLSNTYNFYQQFNRTNTAQHTYTSQGIKFWRKIPTELKVLPLVSFKIKLKKYIFDISWPLSILPLIKLYEILKLLICITHRETWDPHSFLLIYNKSLKRFWARLFNSVPVREKEK